MVPQDNLRNFYKNAILSFVGFVVVAILIFFGLIPLLKFLEKPAYLDVLLLSKDISVTIDGQAYYNGVYTLAPGDYEATISLGGEPQTILPVHLDKNQTTGLYLDSVDASIKQYSLSDISYQRKIDAIFPITFTICDGPASRTNCNAIKVIYGFHQDCGEDKCVIISGRGAELDNGIIAEVKSKMLERGYDLGQYKYIYVQNTSL